MEAKPIRSFRERVGPLFKQLNQLAIQNDYTKLVEHTQASMQILAKTDNNFYQSLTFLKKQAFLLKVFLDFETFDLKNEIFSTFEVNLQNTKNKQIT